MCDNHRAQARDIAAPWVDPTAWDQPEPVDGPWPALEAYACRVLRRAGPRYVLREPDAPDDVRDEVLRWRFLSLALPPALWRAAAHTPPDPLPPPDHVRLLDRMVAPSVPVAHLHLHLGAIASFDLVWSALAARGVPELKKLTDSPMGDDVSDRRRWRAVLTRALLARRMLAEALSQRRPLVEVVDRASSAADRSARRDAISQLVGDQPLDFGNIDREGRIARMARPPRPPARSTDPPPAPWTRPDAVWAADRLPLAGASGGSPESHLLACARHAIGGGWPDPLFARALTRYVRVACLLYRHLTCEAPLDGAAAGLGAFRDVFHRAHPYLAPLRGLLPSLPPDPALDIAAVEARVSPNLRALRQHVGVLAGRREAPRVCLLVHLIRSGRGTLAKRVRRLGKQASALEQALKAEPTLVHHVRGFDLAGDEVGGPAWCAAPALHRLRAAGDRAAARARVDPPGLTLHAGEVGWSNISMLRAIDGLFAWGLLRRGDRLGHALILSRPIQSRLSQSAQARWVRGPRWVRMLDLAWVLGQPEAEAVHEEMPEAEAVHEEMRERLASELDAHWAACGSAAVHDLHGVWRGLGRRGCMVEVLADASVRRPTAPDRRFVFDVLHGCAALSAHGPALSDAGSVDPTADAAVERALVQTLEAIRHRLLVRIDRWQLVIEANPTSNLIIGGGDAPFRQPFFQLRPVERDRAGVVPVTLSTDDPLQFSTSLADEYAYAFAGMVRDRVSASYAREWLQESARISTRAGFGLPARLATSIGATQSGP